MSSWQDELLEREMFDSSKGKNMSSDIEKQVYEGFVNFVRKTWTLQTREEQIQVSKDYDSIAEKLTSLYKEKGHTVYDDEVGPAMLPMISGVINFGFMNGHLALVRVEVTQEKDGVCDLTVTTYAKVRKSKERTAAKAIVLIKKLLEV